MQFSRSAFKKIQNVFQLSSVCVKPPTAAFLPLYNHKNVLKNYNMPEFKRNFSSDVKNNKDNQQTHNAESNSYKELSSIINSTDFDKDLILDTIDKLSQHSLESHENTTIESKESTPRLSEFCSFLVENLGGFTTPTEVERVTTFLINTNPSNGKDMDLLKLYINNYDQLLLMSTSGLKEILPRLFNIQDSNSTEFIHKLSSLLINNKNKIDKDTHAVLLDCLKQILNSPKAGDSPSTDETSNELLNSEKTYLIQNVDELNASSLITLLTYIANDEQSEEWYDLIKKIEDKIAESPESLPSDKTAQLVSTITQIGRKHKKLWLILEEQTHANLTHFSLSDLITVTQCFSSLGKESAELFEEVHKRINSPETQIDAKDIPKIVYFFAQNGDYRENLFAELRDQTIENIPNYGVSDLARILWSFIMTNNLDESLFGLLEQRLTENTQKLGDLDLDLLLDCVICLEDRESKLAPLLIPGLLEAFEDKTNYPYIDEMVALKVYLVRSRNGEVYDALLSLVDDFILFKLTDDAEKLDTRFLLELGDNFGENFDHLSRNETLLKAYIQRMEGLMEAEKDSLEQEQLEHIEFIIENLKGLKEEFIK